MRKFLLTLSLFAGFAFSQPCSGLADLEINYMGTFKSKSDFMQTGNTYSISLPRAADKITLKPTPCYEGAPVTGGFENVYLPVGTTGYTITVDGTSYAVKITRNVEGTSVDTKNILSGLKVSSGADNYALSPSFNKNVNSYSVQIPFKAAGAVSVDATPDYRYGGLRYENSDGEEIPNSGISLLPNTSKIMKIRVIAEDAATQNGIYTLTLNKMAGNTNNNLGSLEVFLNGDAFDNVLLDFDPSVLDYTLEVDNSTETVTVKSAKAVELFGEFQGQHEWIDQPLYCGDNKFEITVVSEIGEKKTYKLNIVRTGCVAPSSSSGTTPSSSSVTEPSSSSTTEPSSSSETPSSSSVVSSSSSGTTPSSSSGEQPSSSSIGDGSSSSGGGTPSSSSGSGTSSSSGGGTPIRLSQVAKGPLFAYASGNAIILGNLPVGAKVEVYNLRGKLISSRALNQVNQGSDMSISVQTKGVYIVKAGTEKFRIAVK
jgi:hypothetical protein